MDQFGGKEENALNELFYGEQFSFSSTRDNTRSSLTAF